MGYNYRSHFGNRLSGRLLKDKRYEEVTGINFEHEADEYKKLKKTYLKTFGKDFTASYLARTVLCSNKRTTIAKNFAFLKQVFTASNKSIEECIDYINSNPQVLTVDLDLLISNLAVAKAYNNELNVLSNSNLIVLDTNKLYKSFTDRNEISTTRLNVLKYNYVTNLYTENNDKDNLKLSLNK